MRVYSLLGLLAVLAVIVASVVGAPVKPSKNWTGSIPNCVAFNNGSVFAAGLDEIHQANSVYRLNPTNGHVQHIYIYPIDFSAQYLWASNASLFVFGFTENAGYFTLETDIATGKLLHNFTNAPSMVIRGFDSAGKVAVVVDDAAVYTYATDTWKVLNTYDGGIKGLKVVGTAIHPNNSHVYILNSVNWQLYDIAPNNTIVRTYTLRFNPELLLWFTIDEEARHAFSMVSDNGAFGMELLDLQTGESRFLSPLAWNEYGVYAQFAARSAGMGEAWIADTNSASLIRLRTAKTDNITSFPLTPYPIIQYANDLALSSDGQSAYVSKIYEQQVVRVNATNGHLISRFAPIAVNDNGCDFESKYDQELAVDSKDQIYFPLCNATILVYTPEGVVSRMIVLADNTTKIHSAAPAPNGVVYLTAEGQLNYVYQVDEATGKVLSSRTLDKDSTITDLLYDPPSDSLWVVDRQGYVYQYAANSSWTLLSSFDLTGYYRTWLSHVAVDHVHGCVIVSQIVYGPGTHMTAQLVWLDMSGKVTSNYTFTEAQQAPPTHQAQGVSVNAKGVVYALNAGGSFAGLILFDHVKAEGESGFVAATAAPAASTD